MSKIDKPVIHEAWGFDILSLYLEDVFRVLYEAYRVILVEKRKSPYTRPASAKKWHLETALTEDLIEIAEDIPRRFAYHWDTESKDTKKKNRIDITIIYSLHLGFEKRLGIECKRLKDDIQLCREYYENGIKRFITGYYSAAMPLAGMIGFIQEGGIDEIITRINTHLNKQAAAQSLTPGKMIENIDYTYFSSHNRDMSSGHIALYHMMLDYRNIIR